MTPRRLPRLAALVALTALLVIGAAAAACGADAGPAAESPPAQAAAPAPAVLGNREWPAAHADPTAVIGRDVALGARVYSEPQVDDDGLSFCAWVDFDNDQLSTRVVVPGATEGVARDSFVRVEGVVTRVAAPDDACLDAGQPQVQASSLVVTNRADLRPALRVVGVEQSLEQLDVRVTLERVEFAADETRIYFTVENRGNETVLAFGTGLRLDAAGAELLALFPIGGGIQAPRGRVDPGTSETGGFLFPPLDPGGPPFTVRWLGLQAESMTETSVDWSWVVDPTGAVTPRG